ncbi:DNA-binding domain-containing protein [Sphingomonas sp. R647]|uniref:HvfC/BufC N-terminal domain-containing protein n=1 Tax=Sphingomonas sp. R647 TaxID=2875233 RepID=UPI001CD7824F|nr:DNA-binding domain-containing protein [Sphingomonas sp. R647]MCA1196999.1 DNA-binding domain-containing protein [Sphingomonas sp. R647]
MSALARLQDAFLACLHDDDAPLPPGWDAARAAGMAVYRNAYRARLIDVLGESYPRTARLVGADAFERAAAHHLIAHPPSAWTIDRAGAGFAQTCAELFAHDADVAEIAWLEWAMHCAWTVANDVPLTGAELAAATSHLGADQWEALRLGPIAGTALRPVAYDLAKLWQSLDGAARAPVVERLDEPGWVLTWREGEQPVFVLITQADGRALDALVRGGTFGELCATLAEEFGPADAAATAAAMLRRWIELGVIRAVDTVPGRSQVRRR